MVENSRPILAENPPGLRSRGAFFSYRLVTGASFDWDDVAEDEVLLVCPWLCGLDPATQLWLAALPIHDCNAFIDGGWSFDAPDALRARCYVGVLALDRLRSSQQVFGRLRELGVAGVINLPSISFFDGETAQTFARLSFSLASEMTFLAQARSHGLATALCAPEGAAVATPAAFDFILRHGGPEGPLVIDDQREHALPHHLI